MQREWKSVLLALLLSVGVIVTESTSETTVSIGPPLTPQKEADVAKEEGRTKRKVALITAYCRQVDRHVQRHSKEKRVFAITDGAPMGKLQWSEVTNSKDGRDKATVGASTWSRAGKIVYVEYFDRSQSYDWPNWAYFYFRSDGTLAKLRVVLNSFVKPQNSEGKFMVILEKFYDVQSDNAVLDQTEDILDPKTRKKKEHLEYTARIGGGLDLHLTRDISRLPFYTLLHKPRPKP